MSYFINKSIAFSSFDNRDILLLDAPTNPDGTSSRYVDISGAIKRAAKPDVQYLNDPYDISISIQGLFHNYPIEAPSDFFDVTNMYILTEDLHCNSLIIPSVTTLYTNGFKIYCKYLEVRGHINADGKDGRPGVIRPGYLLTPDYPVADGDYFSFDPPNLKSYTWSGAQVDLSSQQSLSTLPPFGINSRTLSGDYAVGSTNSEVDYPSSIGRKYCYGGLGVVGGAVGAGYLTQGSNYNNIKTSGENNALGNFCSAAHSTRKSFLNDSIITTGIGGKGGGSGFGTVDTNENRDNDGTDGGSSKSSNITPQNLFNGFYVYGAYEYDSSRVVRYFHGGTGGGAGGSTASDKNRFDASHRPNDVFTWGLRGVATGGCGGDGGLAIWICTQKLVIKPGGKITANGGNGGNGRYYYDGPSGSGGTKAYSIGGGGAGGAGGWIFIYCEEIENKGTVSVTGGQGGSVDASPVGAQFTFQGDAGQNGRMYVISSRSELAPVSQADGILGPR